jgi:2-dehydropantoate 2-reductase
MHVAVIGAGGVGGYFGGKLALSGVDVGFVARGAHLEAIRRNGLRVRAVDGDFTARADATDDPATIGAVDVVLFCVKSYACTHRRAASAPSVRATATRRTPARRS